MSSPKLLSLLSVLDLKQLGSLKKYLLSKTGKDSEPFKLYEYVNKFRLNPDTFQDVEHIHKNVFPTSSVRAIQNNMSLLYNWAEEWVLVQQAKEDKFTQDIMLIKWFNKNGLYDLADATANQVEKNINEKKGHDIDKSYAKFCSLFEQHFSNNPIKYQHKYKLDSDLIASFNEFVKAQGLLLQCELSNWGSINNFDFGDKDEILDGSITKLAKTELTAVLGELKNMVVHNDFDSLLNIKNRLLKGEIREESKLHFIVTSYAINSARKFWDKGLHREKNLIFDLVQYGIKSGFYLGKGKIQSAKFHNLIMFLSSTLPYEAVNDFIEENIDKVNNLDIESTKILAQAQNSFYHHRYEEVEYMIQRNNFATFNQKNIAQGMNLIATFMNRNDEAHLFDKAMTASVSFLKRNKDKMSPHLLESYHNLIKFIKEIQKGKKPDTIETYLPLIYSSWCEYIIKVKN